MVFSRLCIGKNYQEHRDMVNKKTKANKPKGRESKGPAKKLAAQQVRYLP